jgi:hypothetical protein
MYPLFRVHFKWSRTSSGKITFLSTERTGNKAIYAACLSPRHCEPAEQSNPAYPYGLLHPADDGRDNLICTRCFAPLVKAVFFM